MDAADQGQQHVPSDFPRPMPGSLSGVQPKLAMRLVQGKYVEGLTNDELFERYDACRDLALQVADKARTKRAKYLDLSLDEFLRRLRLGVEQKGWDVSPDELTWVMLQVRSALSAAE